MTFTVEEKRRLILFYSGSAGETAAAIRDILPLMYDPEDRAVTKSLMRKLETMSEAEFDCYAEESGAFL